MTANKADPNVYANVMRVRELGRPLPAMATNFCLSVAPEPA